MSTQTVIAIPHIGTVPAYALDPQNKGQVRGLISRFDAYVNISKRAWEDQQERCNQSRIPELEKREQEYGDRCAKLLAPLGIKIDWPGLYPSFTVGGFAEHGTESAVLMALGHPRQWLNQEGGK